jgi:hypothetical protein
LTAWHMPTVALGHTLDGSDFTAVEGGLLRARLGRRGGNTALTSGVEQGRRRDVDGVDSEASMTLGHAQFCGDRCGKMEER